MSVTGRKQYDIDKQTVMKAYLLVKANAGSAGVDKVSLETFENDLKGNLYKVWNRMSSGSYFPPAVRAVPILKKNGGQRILGVPTVADRVAQTVVKLQIEQALEEIFLPDSYGYRPGKSALDAVGVTRQRCWKMDWVLEFDIKGLFDNISHKLLMKAVRKHVQDEWALLYIERWLTAPMQGKDGAITARDRGTPQGGVISPVLANLFLHYAFDTWMARNFPQSPWCRYADDGLVHCRTKAEAEAIKAALQARFEECELEMHPDKTKIVYCKDSNRPGSHASQSFDFLGFTFDRAGQETIRRKKLLYVLASGQQGGDEVYAYDDPAAPAQASLADGSRRNRLGIEPRPSRMDAVLLQIWAVRNAQPVSIRRRISKPLGATQIQRAEEWKSQSLHLAQIDPLPQAEAVRSLGDVEFCFVTC